MNRATITREEFLQDRQGRTFADVVNEPQQPFDEVLAFFDNADRQRRMEESEVHHDRPPLAGVVREFEAQPVFDRFLATQHPRLTNRLRQAVGVLVRLIMERRGWNKTGRKGSLGVRAVVAPRTATPGAYHNTGGLAFWFLRAERYEREEGMPYQSVRKRQQEVDPVAAKRLKSSTTGRSRVAKSPAGRSRRNGT
ncbi:MAG: hypothetical protein K8T25_07870 [Planctomycetia bacterium]|nr:hypothetical protein [Planctomycetia bacterium]